LLEPGPTGGRAFRQAPQLMAEADFKLDYAASSVPQMLTLLQIDK
jgi:hypothetical protein